MLTVAIIGQKWLAESLLAALCSCPEIGVKAVVPPKPGDRLAVAAVKRGIAVYALGDCPPTDLALALTCTALCPAVTRCGGLSTCARG
jgi:hypothetical protein